ncbi:MAG: hypothetical protein HQL23_08640 [Candidatus Omnitrophica bacterium]|nr:hypothetical protein [Candidatus Omnitrophota bacterium]
MQNLLRFIFGGLMVLFLAFWGYQSAQSADFARTRQYEILKAFGLDVANLKAADRGRLFKQKIVEAAIDAKGELMRGRQARGRRVSQGVYPLYVYRENGRVIAYGFPLIKSASPRIIYGYASVSADTKTLRGVAWRISPKDTAQRKEQIWKFTAGLRGKKIWDTRNKTVKPLGETGNRDNFSLEQTIAAVLDDNLRHYDPFFRKFRRNK